MNSIFLKNVTVEGRLNDLDIRDGRFFRIAPAGSLPAPDGVEILDAGGQVAVPGFINIMQLRTNSRIADFRKTVYVQLDVF